MTIEEMRTRVCKQCGARFEYFELLSTNNFAGEFASPLGARPPQECSCGSKEFELIAEIDPILARPVEDLELSDSIFTILRPEIYYIGDLVILTDEQLLALPNFTKGFLQEVKDVLAYRGLSLGCTVDGWPPEGLERPQ